MDNASNMMDYSIFSFLTLFTITGSERVKPTSIHREISVVQRENLYSRPLFIGMRMDTR